MRCSLFLLLVLPFQSAMAWSGIAAFLGQSQGDWLFSGGVKTAQQDFYGLSIEDRTRSKIRIGARAGQFDLRLSPQTSAAAEKFNGKFIAFYLRWPLSLSSTLSFEPRLGYQYNQGEKALLSQQQISWNQVRLQLALHAQLGALSLRPFVAWRRIDGDITTAQTSRLFVQHQSSSYGLALDFFVEPSAYIRFQGSVGARQGASLSFVRAY